MKRKTHEEYVEELKIKNPQVVSVEKYINADTPITHLCLVHNKKWETTPARALNGVGCPLCKKERFYKTRTKTHEEFLEELHNVSPHIKPLGKYITCSTKISFLCETHNVVWDSTPYNVLHGHGCPKCGGDKISERLTMPYPEYVDKLKAVNPNIICIGEYIGAAKKVRHKCLIDGYEWEVVPCALLSGQGCPKCAGNIQKTHDEFVAQMAEINPTIKIIGTYKTAKTPILCKCLVCGAEWETTATPLLSGCGCKLCGIKKNSDALRKTQSEYINEVDMITENIIVLGEYVNSNAPILHECKICGKQWLASPSNILAGHGCPLCNVSHGEDAICKYLDSHNINYEQQKRFPDCVDKRTLPFDFYLPEHNAVIEYDGAQHFKSIPFFGGEKGYEYRIRHDDIKNNYCLKNNIRLLRISYLQDIEKELDDFLFAS